MSEMIVERPRRGRPPKPAAAEIERETQNIVELKQPEPAKTEKAGPKLIEVELVRKYAPTLCYEDTPDGKIVPVLDENGEYKRQDRVIVGEGRDRFGRPVDIYRQLLDDFPAGTVIPLPPEEATRALRLGVAKVTSRTF